MSHKSYETVDGNLVRPTAKMDADIIKFDTYNVTNIFLILRMTNYLSIKSKRSFVLENNYIKATSF